MHRYFHHLIRIFNITHTMKYSLGDAHTDTHVDCNFALAVSATGSIFYFLFVHVAIRYYFIHVEIYYQKHRRSRYYGIGYLATHVW